MDAKLLCFIMLIGIRASCELLNSEGNLAFHSWLSKNRFWWWQLLILHILIWVQVLLFWNFPMEWTTILMKQRMSLEIFHGSETLIWEGGFMASWQICTGGSFIGFRKRKKKSAAYFLWWYLNCISHRRLDYGSQFERSIPVTAEKYNSLTKLSKITRANRKFGHWYESSFAYIVPESLPNQHFFNSLQL